MFKLIPTMSAMKETPRENKRNLILLKETLSISAGGRRITFADVVSGVNVSLPPLLNPSTGSSSASCSVSVPLYSQQGILQQGSMQSQEILGIQGLIPTGAMNNQGSAARLTPLGMQMQLQNIENYAEHLKDIETFFNCLLLLSIEKLKEK
ncbi:uncharacterized protein MONOS_12764 [Monocercomonoides exilis]|uniref:uncharacterized protein n=1 Tax=Monocercomonoides exilis TaxID=2049356 RepID=UPI00355A9176|nr:hypothetical protein MONOS_12764 [Monocercomonoides exilis]|eukprot:MONOS_12764.1-p1 / transcript=MONOS_12764.1 / gene=MONOS_12764 / organism=Monocercomonoides_exilis_PA203 / gene_product=unspecified product / transcript_product=unspecified product / location=Mono_scaffold00730:12760-13212(+) / protein_length=151 / sequence_SO=supercontig / SO=protein_coding / is_pseudo=false